MKDKDIGLRLQEARETEGLSQAELAKELGYDSATAVSLIEAGKRKLNAQNLQKAAKVLNRSMSYFLVGENPKIDIKVALRADKELTDEDKKAVMHFIDLAKKRHGGNKSQG